MAGSTAVVARFLFLLRETRKKPIAIPHIITNKGTPSPIPTLTAVDGPPGGLDVSVRDAVGETTAEGDTSAEEEAAGEEAVGEETSEEEAVTGGELVGDDEVIRSAAWKRMKMGSACTSPVTVSSMVAVEVVLSPFSMYMTVK